MKNLTLILATTAAFAAASQASAQTPAAGAAQPPSPAAQAAIAAQANPTGPAINGFCVLSSDMVLGTSTVGRYAAQRLQAIEAATNTELNTARTTAQNEMRTLEAQRATLGEQSFVTQANALNARFETLVNTRTREFQATGQAAENRIKTEMTPVIIDSYRAKNCTVMVDASAVILRGDAMDVTNDVITRLNAKITQFPLERLTATAAAAPAGPAAAPVATIPPAGGARPQGPTR